MTAPDTSCEVVKRAEVFIKAGFPNVKKHSAQWNDLVMTFVAGSLETVVFMQAAIDINDEELSKAQTQEVIMDTQKASNAYLRD